MHTGRSPLTGTGLPQLTVNKFKQQSLVNQGTSMVSSVYLELSLAERGAHWGVLLAQPTFRLLFRVAPPPGGSHSAHGIYTLHLLPLGSSNKPLFWQSWIPGTLNSQPTKNVLVAQMAEGAGPTKTHAHKLAAISRAALYCYIERKGKQTLLHCAAQTADSQCCLHQGRCCCKCVWLKRHLSQTGQTEEVRGEAGSCGDNQ